MLFVVLSAPNAEPGMIKSVTTQKAELVDELRAVIVQSIISPTCTFAFCVGLPTHDKLESVVGTSYTAWLKGLLRIVDPAGDRDALTWKADVEDTGALRLNMKDDPPFCVTSADNKDPPCE